MSPKQSPFRYTTVHIFIGCIDSDQESSIYDNGSLPAKAGTSLG